MNLIRDLARALLRFGVVWILDIASLLLTAAIFPGIGFEPNQDILVVAAAAAFLLGIVNFLVRPLILLLALPFGFIAIFLVGFFLNAIALLLTSQLVEGFYVNSWLDAFLGSLVLAVLNTLLTSIIAVDNDDSFYLSIAERLAQREAFFANDNTQGIVMMEIDGLSYHHIKKAIAEGWMPTLKQLMNDEGYVLSRFDCGLPSQTSACQAGIMFGKNDDIPAFRWYDKTQDKLIVSSRDAPAINARYAQGGGLMRDGSSVNNMLNGDARISILTLADLLGGTEEQRQRRAQDVYLIMLNPYFFLRTLVLYFGDVIREVVEGLVQQLRRQAPRLNRLAHFYPFLRAATTVLMRDISAYLTMLDIARGTPALYVTWPGYDEVAHHSGPWTRDAFRTLRQYDQVIRRIHDTIQRKAPRPYELVILSDHGQSYGWTFKQRYGKTLREFIVELMPQGSAVLQSSGGDDGIVSVRAMAMELDNMQRRKMGGRIGKRVIRNAQRAAERGIEARASERNIGRPNLGVNEWTTTRPTDRTKGKELDQPTNVVVCGSGNLAQVYFTTRAERLTLGALNALYPQLLDALIQHAGIGIVMAYSDNGAAIAFGKKGARNVFTDDVTGEDPLTAYGDANLRARQLKRLAEFPNNGDLTIISTYYPDGTVAAMEELVGNHGGIGGEQTDAFIFHPPTFEIPATTNSADVFQVLNARRGLPAEKKEASEPNRRFDDWAPLALGKGLSRVSEWAPLVVRAIVLDRAAYRKIAFNPYMTAPALAIALLANLLTTTIVRGAFDPVEWATRFGAWFVGVLCVFGAARALRGKASFTSTLRAAGFAQSASIIQILAWLPPLAAMANLAALVISFLATWMAVSEAHKLRGWRTLLLPIAAVFIGVASVLILDILYRGAALSLETLAQTFGLLAR